MSTIHVKLQIESEFRRFTIESQTKFFQLKEKINTILRLDEDFSIQYKDEEQEWITITSDEELFTGLTLLDKIFRIKVVPVNDIKSDDQKSENYDQDQTKSENQDKNNSNDPKEEDGCKRRKGGRRFERREKGGEKREKYGRRGKKWENKTEGNPEEKKRK
jgi:hypothetical protein